jgi:hypothetical protein
MLTVVYEYGVCREEGGRRQACSDEGEKREI